MTLWREIQRLQHVPASSWGGSPLEAALFCLFVTGMLAFTSLHEPNFLYQNVTYHHDYHCLNR